MEAIAGVTAAFVVCLSVVITVLIQQEDWK